MLEKKHGATLHTRYLFCAFPYLQKSFLHQYHSKPRCVQPFPTSRLDLFEKLAMADDQALYVRNQTPTTLQPWESYICEHCENRTADVLTSYEDVVTHAKYFDKQLCFRCTSALLLNMPDNLMFLVDDREQCIMPIRHALDQKPDEATQAEEHHPVKRMRTNSRILDHTCDRCDLYQHAVSLQFTTVEGQSVKHTHGDFCFACAAVFLIDFDVFPGKHRLKPGKTSLIDYP